MSNTKEDNKNLIMAVLLSLVVMTGWQVFYAGPKQEVARKYAFEQRKEELKAEARIAANLSISQEAEEYETVINAKLLSREEALEKSNSDGIRLKIISNKLHGSMNLKGARFDDLTLGGYRQELRKDSPDVVLLSPSSTKNAYFADFGWLSSSSSVKTPNSKSLWKADKAKLAINIPVNLTWDNGGGLLFTRTITLDENYMFTVKQSVQNSGDTPVTLSPYGLISHLREDQMAMYISHEGPLGVFDKVLNEATYDEIKDDRKQVFKGVHGWLGISDKYWLVALVPDKSLTFDAKYNYRMKNKMNRYQVDFLGNQVVVASGETLTLTNHFFAGAKEVDLLDSYVENLNIPLFDRAVDFGWLYFMTKPISQILRFFYSWLENFGLAMMLLTVILRLCLFPLANKSYKSMAQMRKVMPEMQGLRDRYKDDKAKMNQEMMKFYQERKINPMSGCLPMLVQIPIFFALYKVFYITIEMRHAPFYGWIHDLSALDPTNILNLFGFINWTPPEFLPVIGILPILFCITMILQQKLNPPPTDPTQAMIMKWLPFIFLFLFANFPAGLVLYWTWNNILSILQQWYITRKINAEE